jgi:hypothetical protein
MLTLFVVVALLVGGVFAGEFVRGQCRRMLSRPHPSVLAVRLATQSDAVAGGDQVARA